MTWKADKKKAQEDVDAVRTKIDASESNKARNQRKVKKLQGELTDLKAANAALEKEKAKGSVVNLEEEQRRIDKDLKASQSSLDADEKELKNVLSELEMLRDLFRKAVTTTGESVILSVDGRSAGKSASRSASGSSVGSASVGSASVDSPSLRRNTAANTSSSRFK